MTADGKTKEIILLIIVSLITLFFGLSFSREFGSIYTGMITVWFMILVFDLLLSKKGSRLTFPVESKTKNRFYSIFIAVVAYSLFLLVTTIITTIFSPQIFVGAVTIGDKLMAVISSQASFILQASSEALKDSKILMFIGWAILIPIVETILLNGRMFEFIYDYMKSKGFNLDRPNFMLIMIFLFIGAFSTLLHLSSKALNASALMVTFLFFSLSTFLVWWQRETKSAILLHILSNSIAVMSILKVIK